MSDDRADIEAVVQTYLDGLYEGDGDKLAASFHPTSALAEATEAGIAVVPRDQWIAAVRGRPSPRSQGLSRHDEIVLVDQASPTCALVKVKCALPPRFFTDYLSLLKIDGRWVVAQKVFATTSRGEAQSR